MADKLKNTNDLVYLIAARVKKLGDMKMPELRDANGYGCDNDHQAQEKDAGKSRGEIMEEILVEEFTEEFPKDICED